MNYKRMIGLLAAAGSLFAVSAIKINGTQQEKNAAMADYSFASPEIKDAVLNQQNEALIGSNVADMQKGTGFAYTKEELSR